MPPDDLPRLRRRARDTSKHDYGRVVVVGGATGMAGAPALSAMAALRSGAGLVEALVPRTVAAITAGFDPCVMVHGLEDGPEGTFAGAAGAAIASRAAAAAAAVGPGLGRSAAVVELVAHLWRTLPRPAVFDADALWALAAWSQAPGGRDVLAVHAGPRILTPHAGEMLRLLGADPTSAGAADRVGLERQTEVLAAAIDAVFVLKGPGSLVVDGTRRSRNETGNPGMATAGTGDVLTGIIAALVAQGLVPFASARLAAWVHGRAGDLAAESVGEVSMTARDLLHHLPRAFREVTAAS